MKKRNQRLLLAGIILFCIIASCRKGEAPSVSTSETTNITGSGATSGGSITSEGSATITARGVCWSTQTKPKLTDSKTLDGEGAGDFTSILTGLNPATTYYVRAYATNSAGTGYGMVMSFTTEGSVPTTVTNSAFDIDTHQATLSGQINPNYISTSASFEYGTTTSYGKSVDFSLNPLTGNGFYGVTALVADLTPGTTYHFRVKAVNSLGTTYGDDMQFTTTGGVPVIVSSSFGSKSSTAATFRAIINPNFLSTVVTLEYGTSTGYGSSVNATPNQIEGSGNSSVSTSITGLSSNTTYHLRIKAVNEAGITYGDDFTFIPPSPVIDADGNSYNTVIIGSQTWMESNLEVTKFNDVTDIPLVTDDNVWAGLTSSAYCWYFNDESSSKGTSYGALYNWYAASSGKICPTGWHVPSQVEWTALEDYLSINGYNYDGSFSYNAYALALADPTGWNYSMNSGSPGNSDYPEKRNISGFSAVPAGVRDANQLLFGARGYYAIFWTSTSDSDNTAYDRGIDYSLSSVGTGVVNKRTGFSIRCLKN
jgi:uncharacterized protein (TIGR02145 family)